MSKPVLEFPLLSEREIQQLRKRMMESHIGDLDIDVIFAWALERKVAEKVLKKALPTYPTPWAYEQACKALRQHWEDTRRLEWMLEHWDCKVIEIETATEKGWRVLKEPVTWLSRVHSTPREALDEAMKEET